MRIFRIARLRLRSLLRGSSTDLEMRREIDVHLEQLAKEYRAAGLTDTEAQLAARRAFGSLDVVKEQCRDMRRVNWAEDFAKDVAYALRILGKSPGFSLTAILSLALGIGANTAIFSVVNAFLIRPLPFPNPEQLVVLFEREVIGDESRMSVAPGNFLDWQEQTNAFASMSAYTTNAAAVAPAGGEGGPERVGVCACSGNVFATLGISPLLGRTFFPAEDRFGGARVAVISYDLWQRQFGGTSDVVGRGLRMNGQDYQIVGVMPRTFMFPHRNVHVWRPLLLTIAPVQQDRHDLHYLQVVARVRDGISVQQADVELDAIAARYRTAHPNEATGRGVTTVPLHEQLVEGVQRLLFILLGAVTCVLLIACVNIANLVFTRALARTREIGVRAALGASRGRLIRQLITESVVLSLVGGILGALMASSLTTVLVANAPGADAILPPEGVRVDPSVFVFAFAVALLSGTSIGLLPAIRATRKEVVTDLKEMTRTTTSSRAHSRMRGLFVGAEMALSVLLLIAAGLLLRSFMQLYAVEPGIRVDRTLTLATTLAGASYREPAQRSAFLATLGERMRVIPGVTAAGLTSCPPLTGACNVLFFYVDGRPYTPGKFLAALERSVDPDYFRAAGIPLIRGRSFTRRDGVGFNPREPRLGSLVISEAMAKTFFPGEDPIGKRVFFDFEMQRERNEGFPAPRYEIIGIVRDVLPRLDGTITPTMYRPLLDVANSGVTAILHTSVDPPAVASGARGVIRDLDRSLTVYAVQTLRESIDQSTANRQFTMLLFALFAALALLLAAIGLYGVVSYAVSQRRAEIGIRLALGATKSSVSRMVMMQGLKPALVGSLVGLTVALLSSGLLKTLLFGVTPVDPITFAVVPVLLLIVAASASYVPAVRAGREDPTTALRME